MPKQKFLQDTRALHSYGVEIEYDLANEKPHRLEFDVQNYNKISVQVVGIGATGTSGNVGIKRSNDKGKAFDFAVAQTIALAANDSNLVGEIDIYTKYVVLDYTAATFGSVGRLKVIVVGKHS